MVDIQNSTDNQLLELFARGRDNDAFREIFHRHYRLAWSACLRGLCGHEHLAEDAVQAVFLVLFRRAGRIRSGCALSVWLYQTARYVSSNVLRMEMRRREREKKAADMRDEIRNPAQEAGWGEVRRNLDEAIGRLPGRQRDAVVMHYLAGKSLGEISAETGTVRATVQKRVEAGLEKLRSILSSRGTAISAPSLAILLAKNSLEAAPAQLEQALFAAISQNIAAGGSAIGGMVGTMVNGFVRGMFLAKLKVAAAIIFALSVPVGLFALTAGGNSGQSGMSPGGENRPQKSAIAEKVANPVINPASIINPADRNAGVVSIAVDCGKKHQIIRGFGTSVKGWSQPDKDPAVKWQMDPKGLDLYVKDGGFSVARMGVDRWVIEGENPARVPVSVTGAMMDDPAKTAFDSFRWERIGRPALGEDGKVSRGIRWFQELKKLNPDMLFTASVWSPPHWMKEKAPQGPGAQFEWKGLNSCGGRLAPKYYRHFAHFLAQYCLAMEQKFQVPLYSISIQNEPCFREDYDSCVYTPDEFHDVVAEVAAVFKALGVKTKIMGPEDMTRNPDRVWGFVKPILADAGTRDALEIVCSHGYSDGVDANLQSYDAAKLWEYMKDSGKEYWMTETGGGPENWEGEPIVDKRSKMPGNALDSLGTRIHNAIVLGQASAWFIWLFIENEDNKQTCLVLSESMAKLTPTKKFYIQKHYARFIPPGTRRVETGKDSGGILASAFAYNGRGVFTAVIQNHNNTATAVRLNMSGGPAVESLAAWITDAGRNCERTADVPVNSGVIELKMPPRSIMTLATLKE
ncbi:MAG: sigma-70 family RNA polymerase sigma factor [Planctomycetes bacterium]|nr:sigma-70 family RNA polymerase sigma factor [Planctomycetota bacterium]